MRIKPGAMRELHWHATASEWGFVTEVSVRTTGVVLEMDPGALRELHCHPNASEWQYALSGDFRVTLFAFRGALA